MVAVAGGAHKLDGFSDVSIQASEESVDWTETFFMTPLAANDTVEGYILLKVDAVEFATDSADILEENIQLGHDVYNELRFLLVGFTFYGRHTEEGGCFLYLGEFVFIHLLADVSTGGTDGVAGDDCSNFFVIATSYQSLYDLFVGLIVCFVVIHL